MTTRKTLKSTGGRPIKLRVAKKSKKMLVQVRIPEEEHRLLAALAGRHGQTIAHRLHMVIREELDRLYPVVIVSFDGRTVSTRVIVESPGDWEYWSVLVTPADAVLFLPEALQHTASVVLPSRTPRVFGIESGYQDSEGVWHLMLRKTGATGS